MRWPGLLTCMTLLAPGALSGLVPPAVAVQQPAGQEEPAPEYLGYPMLLDGAVAALRADGAVFRDSARAGRGPRGKSARRWRRRQRRGESCAGRVCRPA